MQASSITSEAAYTDLCMSYDWACYLNDHLTMLMPKTRWGNFSGPIAEFASDIINNEVNITYPIGWRGSEPIYFGALVGRPHLVDRQGHFDHAIALRLTYNVRQEKVRALLFDAFGEEGAINFVANLSLPDASKPTNIKCFRVGNISYIWRKKVAAWLTDKARPPSELVEFGVTHNESLPEGLQDVADTLTPKFVEPSKECKGWKSKLSGAFKKLETKLEHHEKHSEQTPHEETFVNKLFREIIGPFLLERSTQVCAVLLYIVYMTLAILGCLNVKEGLDPRFLVRESFYLNNFYRLIHETFWYEGLQMQVVVNRPPDLFNTTQRAKFTKMMADFENTEYTMNHNATMIWLDAYELHLEREKNELNIEKPFKSLLRVVPSMSRLAIGGRWPATLGEKDMVWGRSEEDFYTLKAFRFQLGLRNYQTPTDHTNSCKLMREIASRYPDFNVTTFHEYYPFADQYLELKPSLVQNFTFGLLAMFAVTVIMIPDARAALAVVLCIASVNIGVLGFMTFWGVNLDSVSMITLIMCIGFAVDLSAHIAYAYSQAYGTAHERAVYALETLGWPVFLVSHLSSLLQRCHIYDPRDYSTDVGRRLHRTYLFQDGVLSYLIFNASWAALSPSAAHLAHSRKQGRFLSTALVRREPVKADFHTPRAVFTCDSPQIPMKISPSSACVKASSSALIADNEPSEPVNESSAAVEPSDEDVVKATVDRLTGKIVTPDDASAR
ncbi:patched family protein [Ostertagia ostertagi]